MAINFTLDKGAVSDILNLSNGYKIDTMIINNDGLLELEIVKEEQDVAEDRGTEPSKLTLVRNLDELRDLKID